MEPARQVVVDDDEGAVRVALDAIAGWEVESRAQAPQRVITMPQEHAGPFVDNVTVSVEPVPSGAAADIDAVRTIAAVQMHALVPDLHLIDDRPIEIGGRAAWFRASLETGPGDLTLVTRQVFTVCRERIVTVALTSLPFRDSEAAHVFEVCAASLSVVGIEGNEVPE